MEPGWLGNPQEAPGKKHCLSVGSEFTWELVSLSMAGFGFLEMSLE